MRLPSLHSFASGILAVAKRFPTLVLVVLAATIVSMQLVANSRVSNSSEHNAILARILASLNICLTLGLAVDLLCEQRGWNNLIKWVLRPAVLCVGIAIYYWLNPYRYESDIYTMAALLVATHLSVSFLPFLKGHDSGAFWRYNKALFLRILLSGLYSAVLFAGIAIALAASNELFKLHIDGYQFGQVWVLCFVLFCTLFFLAGVPKAELADTAVEAFPKGLKIFTQFVLIPLVSIYFIILLIYEAKIAMEGVLPEGYVSYLILAFSIFGILSLLLIFPLRKNNDAGWIRVFSKAFYIAMIPLLVLLWLAFYKRWSDYGFTEPRYMLLLLAFWLSAVCLYFLFSRNKNIKFIPISLCVMAIIAAFGGPLSASSVGERSQLARFQELLKNPVDSNSRDLLSALTYLADFHGVQVFQPYVQQDLTGMKSLDSYTARDSIKKLLKLSHLEEYTNVASLDQISYQIYQKNPIIDIAGFNSALPISMYRYDRILETGQLKVALDEHSGISISQNGKVYVASLKNYHKIIAQHLQAGPQDNYTKTVDPAYAEVQLFPANPELKLICTDLGLYLSSDTSAQEFKGYLLMK